MNATPILYLDLDGTVRKGYNELGRFVNTVADVEVFPEVPSILRQYKNAGWRIVAVTNQGGVALGHIPMGEMGKIMVETHKQCDGLFDKMMMCVHHPDSTDPEFAVCWCRKPRIGLVIEAAIDLSRKHDEFYPPHLALFVGDRPEDRGCAEGANISFMDAQEWRGMKIHPVRPVRA
jgi:D-glycero-D-manno-heptose 1,7-bisphosphate phosphatase